MSSPGIILTSAFTLPAAKPFKGFTGYITRANALAEKPDRTPMDEIELSLVNSRLFKTEEPELELVVESGSKDGRAHEAEEILSNQQDQHEKYLRYMTRAKAILAAPAPSQEREEELKRIGAAMNEAGLSNSSGKKYYGTFTADEHNIGETQLKNISGAFARGQQHGSVLYEDVVSFDTAFLKKLGVYDPEKDGLTEEPLVKAGRAMMKSMADSEGLENGTWLASFHRNTEHVHIHFAFVEQVNTRELVVGGEGNRMRAQPRGKRKQSTIDKMKSAFTHVLVDRTEERKRIGRMRDGLIKETRGLLPGKNDTVNKLVDLMSKLPEDRRWWNYATLHGDNKDELDEIVSDLMDGSERYEQYKAAVDDSAQVDIELYGRSKRETKDYAENQLKDVNKRLGNQVLSYLKNLDKTSGADAASVLRDAGFSKDDLSYDYVKKVADNIRKNKVQRHDTNDKSDGDDDDIKKRIRREEQQRMIRQEQTPLRLQMTIRRDLSMLKRSLSDYMDNDRYAAMRDYQRSQDRGMR